MSRLCSDVLTGVAFHDDSQVEKLLVEKVDGERPRVRVKARPMPVPLAA